MLTLEDSCGLIYVGGLYAACVIRRVRCTRSSDARLITDLELTMASIYRKRAGASIGKTRLLTEQKY